MVGVCVAMDDLLKWLREQIDEDERVAQAAPTVLDYGEWPFWVDVDDHQDHEATGRYRDHFKPSRALREVEANRRTIDESARTLEFEDYGYTLAEFVLKALALPYVNRPGYREEWRP